MNKFTKIIKGIGSVLWLIVKCIGYLLYCISFVWLFVDLTSKKK